MVRDGYHCCRTSQCMGPDKHDKNCPEVKPWTVQRVKDELPDVQIMVKGKLEIGAVRGRSLPHAGVVVWGQDITSYQFAWETIADCLNRGVPLRA